MHTVSPTIGELLAVSLAALALAGAFGLALEATVDWVRARWKR